MHLQSYLSFGNSCVLSKVSSREAHEVFGLVFDCIDRDGTERIDLAELRSFVADIQTIFTHFDSPQGIAHHPRIKELLVSTDANGDGRLSHIEVVRAMRRNPEIRELIHS